RLHTGAYMASAMPGVAPNRNGPPDLARHSRQIVNTRSISACAPAQILNLGWRALMFIGSAERRLANPECISPQIERQRERASVSVGSKPASGFSSLRYSPIAKVSHTITPPWVRHGTRKDGDN